MTRFASVLTNVITIFCRRQIPSRNLALFQRIHWNRGRRSWLR